MPTIADLGQVAAATAGAAQSSGFDPLADENILQYQ
jgi:hypothetical protein